jgi:hypothetical protein
MVQEGGRSSHWADRQILDRGPQIRAALQVVGWLKQRFGLKMRDVIGHAMANGSPYFRTSRAGETTTPIGCRATCGHSGTGSEGCSGGDRAAAGAPGFVSSSDYHHQSGSPAIDRANPNSTVGRDFDGIPRPQGAAFDIGAFEAP